MGNCLVTRLKEVVNNDNLLKIGELKIKCNPSVTIRFTAQQRVTFSSPVTVYNNVGTEIAQNQSYYDVSVSLYKFVAAGEMVVSIPDKYSISQLYLGAQGSGNSIESAELNGLSGMESLVTLNIFANHRISGIYLDQLNPSVLADFFQIVSYDGDAEVFGNISAFSDKVNLKRIVFNAYGYSRMDVEGDIENLNSLTKLEMLSLRDTRTSGNADNFLTAIAASGRTIDLMFVPSVYMTFQGGTGYQSLVTIKFNGSMVNPTAADTERGWQVVS